MSRQKAVCRPLHTILIVSFLIVCFGCRDTPKITQPSITQTEECRVGDACIFRPTFGSALVFTSLRAHQRFLRANLEVPDESFAIWRDSEAKGDYAVLLKGTQIRVLKDVE